MNLAIYRLIVERSMGNKKSSKHNSEPLAEALNYLSGRRYVLPSFQRDFVWKMEQIEELFNSVRLGYPFGTLLLWRINIGSDANVLQNESFYTFIQNFCEDKNNTGQQKWSLLPGNDYWVVLDGQQRLTSLNIGLLGSYRKRARYQRKNNPDYPEFRLYMLVSEDVENPFRFIKNEESHLEECFTDPKTGMPVMVKIGRYGPLVQMGSADNEAKPRFASLQHGQSIETLTLEEALRLFDLPRDLGKFEDAEVTIGVGHYGPYVKHNGKYASIPKEYSPNTITYDEAVALIKAQREADAKKVIKTFDEDPDIKVLNGRYGPYIAYKKQNVKIPKGKDAQALTIEECREIIADEANLSKGGARKRATRTRSTARKTTAKK